MKEFFGALLPLVFAGYVISVGFGIIVAQGRGAAAVNRFWMRTLRAGTSGLFRFASWGLGEIARLIR